MGRGTGSTLRLAVPGGGLAPASSARRALAVPGGGLPSLPPVAPAFSFAFCPHPPAPPSRREGGDFGFSYARGFAPCIPGAGWDAALAQPCVWRCLAGGLPQPRRLGERWRCPAGACPLCRLSPLPLALPFAPIPPPPLPGGKGEILVFLMQGASPLASPGLDGARHWLDLRLTVPYGKLTLFAACHSCL